MCYTQLPTENARALQPVRLGKILLTFFFATLLLIISITVEGMPMLLAFLVNLSTNLIWLVGGWV